MLFQPKALALVLTQRRESTPAVYRHLLAAMGISTIRISVRIADSGNTHISKTLITFVNSKHACKLQGVKGIIRLGSTSHSSNGLRIGTPVNQ